MSIEQSVQKISDAISELLHGQSRDKVINALSQDSSPNAVAALLYRPAKQAIQEAETMMEVDDEFIFAVVTDAIDMVIEILEAMGKMEDDDEFRKATLMAILMLHAEQSEEDPEQRAEAQQSLLQMQKDGTMNTVQNLVNEDAKKAGIDPSEFEQSGAEMVQPKQNPLAAGVRQGLA